MLNDPLANLLSTIEHAERIGKSTCTITPVSTIILKTLDILNMHGYVGAAEKNDEQNTRQVTINLLGAINKCGVIKPRFSVKRSNYEKYEKRFLPSKQVGILIISTSQGIMTHREAKQKNLGGRLIAYCY